MKINYLKYGILLLIVMAFILVFSQSGEVHAKPQDKKKIEICHITNGKASYIPIEISVKPLRNEKGHFMHNDIIPPIGEDQGLNWENEGKQIWQNLCGETNNNEDDNNDDNGNDESENDDEDNTPDSKDEYPSSGNTRKPKISVVNKPITLDVTEPSDEDNQTEDIIENNDVKANNMADSDIQGAANDQKRCPWWWLISIGLAVLLAANYVLAGDYEDNKKLSKVLSLSPILFGLSAIFIHVLVSGNYVQTIFCSYLWLIVMIEIIAYYLLTKPQKI